MKYNICYNKRDFDAAIKFVNLENPYVTWDEERLMTFIRQGALENVEHLEAGSDNWNKYSSTGGITLIYSHVSFTKKGYPIIDVEISVTPSFAEYNYINEKVRV